MAADPGGIRHPYAKNTHPTANPDERSAAPRLQWVVVAQLRTEELIRERLQSN